MAWVAIEKTFQSQTRARRMAMKAQLQSLSKGSLFVMEYIERKRAISYSLAENLHPVSDEDLIAHILNGLDSSYGAFTTAFLMKTEPVTVDDLVVLLLQEEARLDQEHARLSATVTTPDTPAPTALAAARHNNTRHSFSLTKSTSNYTSTGRNPDTRCRRIQCQLCSKPGHEAIDCWHRGNQTDFPSRRRPQQRQANVAQFNSPSTIVDPSWYFDSGATDHVTSDLQCLNLAAPYQGSDKVQVGNGQDSSSGGR